MKPDRESAFCVSGFLNKDQGFEMSVSEILVKSKMSLVQTNCATKSLKLPHLDNSYYTES